MSRCKWGEETSQAAFITKAILLWNSSMDAVLCTEMQRLQTVLILRIMASVLSEPGIIWSEFFRLQIAQLLTNAPKFCFNSFLGCSLKCFLLQDLKIICDKNKLIKRHLLVLIPVCLLLVWRVCKTKFKWFMFFISCYCWPHSTKFYLKYCSDNNY